MTTQTEAVLRSTPARSALKLAQEGVEIHAPNSPEYIVCAALIEALAQPAVALEQRSANEHLEPVAHPFEDKAVISALSWAAGLIEQAYRECGGHNGADSWLMNYADKQGERIRQADHREWEKVNGRWQVKVTPPQRDSSATPLTWVGLTDEEIEMIVENRRAAHWEFVRQVEAKLKEKNNG